MGERVDQYAADGDGDADGDAGGDAAGDGDGDADGDGEARKWRGANSSKKWKGEYDQDFFEEAQGDEGGERGGEGDGDDGRATARGSGTTTKTVYTGKRRKRLWRDEGGESGGEGRGEGERECSCFSSELFSAVLHSMSADDEQVYEDLQWTD